MTRLSAGTHRRTGLNVLIKFNHCRCNSWRTLPPTVAQRYQNENEHQRIDCKLIIINLV